MSKYVKITRQDAVPSDADDKCQHVKQTRMKHPDNYRQERRLTDLIQQQK